MGKDNTKQDEVIPRCFFCGAPLVWTGDTTGDEISCELSEEDTVSLWQCQKCKCDYEVTQYAHPEEH